MPHQQQAHPHRTLIPLKFRKLPSRRVSSWMIGLGKHALSASAPDSIDRNAESSSDLFNGDVDHTHTAKLGRGAMRPPRHLFQRNTDKAVITLSTLIIPPTWGCRSWSDCRKTGALISRASFSTMVSEKWANELMPSSACPPWHPDQAGPRRASRRRSAPATPLHGTASAHTTQ